MPDRGRFKKFGFRYEPGLLDRPASRPLSASTGLYGGYLTSSSADVIWGEAVRINQDNSALSVIVITRYSPAQDNPGLAKELFQPVSIKAIYARQQES